MKKLILFLSIFFTSPLPLLAQVYISEVMPNTDDDANMEYIDIVNSGCESVDISGYQLADKEKSYTFAAGSMITSHETYRLTRPTSKIVLNNTSEELSLRDTGWTIVHTFTYASSMKWGVITVPWITLDTCVTDDGWETTEESTDTTEDTWTGTIEEDIPPSGSEEDWWDMADDSDIWEEATWTGDIDEWVEETSTGALDEDGEDISQDEDLGIQENEDDTSSWVTDGGSDNSSDGQWDEDIQTSNLLGKSGSLAPQLLLYSDSDGDNRIDMLEVLYDIYITGSIDVSKISLYSNTGWLYEERVNTATGYILDAEIEDNILRLFLEPSHYEKNILIHNATTQSDIRLKSSDGFSITSLTWVLVEDFLLTSSFDAYREVYEKSKYESLWQEDEWGWVMDGNSWTTVVSFPEIVPTIQNYTNTTLSGNVFICRETPCRLNLNFEPIFNSIYPSDSYGCQVSYNGTTEDKCNPSQWTPTSAWWVEVRIIHKATGQYRSQYFPVEWRIIQNQATVQNTYDRSPPVNRIRLNGTLTKKQIQKSENHIICYTNTCSLNFDASDTYDPDGSSMTYTWSLSGKVFATKKNPTTQEFWLWEHIVEFTATDTSGKVSKSSYTVTVMGDAEVPDTEVMVASEVSSVTNGTKKKRWAMNFFSPPELIIEKSSLGLSRIGNGYRCVSNSASCSVNFGLTWAIDGIYYRFSYSHDVAPLWSTNPRSKSFQTGKYTLKLSAHYEKDGEPIWQETIPIEIIRVKKAKTTKTSLSKTKTTSVEKSPSAIDIIPTAYADDGTTESSDSGLVFSLLFFSLLLNWFFLTRRKGNNV